MKSLNPFSAGDRVYVEKSSITTMTNYAMNKDKFSCPCAWKKEYGIVTEIHGNYVHCKHEIDPHRDSVFFYKDLRLEE